MMCLQLRHEVEGAFVVVSLGVVLVSDVFL